MKNLNIIAALSFLLVFFTSCENDGGTSVVPLKEGALSNFSLVEGSDDFIDLNTFNSLSLQFSLDVGEGNPDAMDLKAFWTTVEGDLYGPIIIDTDITNFPSQFTLTGSDIIAAFPELSSSSDVNVGDKLTLFTSVEMPDGRKLSLLNNEAEPNYYAADFNQYPNLKIIQEYPVSCASDLAGTYNVVSNGTSTEPGIPAAVDLPYTVTLTANGGGNYTISDGVAGVYIYWYSGFGYTFETNGNFTDVCGSLSGSWSEAFGCQVDLTGNVNEDGTLSIHWENCFGDVVDAVYTPQ
jgi:hypothetical protein